jgi:amino acid transporter
VVSAAAAASYLAGEVSLPFPVYVGAILVLVLLTLVSLSGLRESARIAAGILAMHVSPTVSPIFLLLIIRSKVTVMAMLIVTSTIALGRSGTAQLSANWSNGHTGLSTVAIARQVFNGVCIRMLGLTGFECESFYQQSTVFPCLIPPRCTRIYSKDEAELLS